MTANRREPKSCLGRVFKFKIGRLGFKAVHKHNYHTATSRVENSAQVLSCHIKFVHFNMKIFCAKKMFYERY